jgi:hypothetical protein
MSQHCSGMPGYYKRGSTHHKLASVWSQAHAFVKHKPCLVSHSSARSFCGFVTMFGHSLISPIQNSTSITPHPLPTPAADPRVTGIGVG